ncbi:MAG: ATP-binding protein [Methanothrix sp.]|nr:ATP-binding protein [Methanothrix sp.]
MTFFGRLPSVIRDKLLYYYERTNNSIYHRVNFAMLALTLSILLIVGVLSFGFMRRLVRQNIQQTLESDAVQASLRLEEAMNSISESLSTISANLIITNALVDTTGRDTYIVPFMKSYKLENNIAVKLTLCDFVGTPIASNVQNPETFNSPELLKRTIGQGKKFAKLINSGNGKSLQMAFPVIWVMTNKPEGLLVAEIRLEELFNNTLPSFSVSSDRSVSLLSSSNILLQKNKRDEAIFFRMKKRLRLQPPLDEMAFQFEIDDYRKMHAGWLIGIYFAAGLMFIAVTMWVSKTISLKLTGRLMVLSDAAKRITEGGSLELKAEVKGSDEIAALATAFNSMVGKVREAHDSLETRVKERTEQLFLTNEELKYEMLERERMEQDLRESEQFIRNVLDTVDEGFIVIDRDFFILTANKAYCSQLGKTCDDVIGRHCYEISHKVQRPCFETGEDCAVRKVFDTGQPCTTVHKHADTHGAVLYVETKAFPIKDGSGAVTSVIETVNNITETHLLEEERLKTQKLEAIGALAGGIAHDFNNLLQGIFGYISLAKMTLDRKERSLAMLEQAEQALNMSVNLTTQLLTFSKGGKPVKKKLRLQTLIENSVKFALSGSTAEYRIFTDEDLWAVEADEGQIGQVIQNIVLNADQAMPSGGTIVIRARNLHEPEKTHSTPPLNGKYIVISVQDTGIGIAGKYLDKIFDPYFTTRKKGSGLGLATSYSIIRNHGGIIDVASEPGEGTTFVVYIPALEAEIEASAASVISAATATARKGKILVMDDEMLMRKIAEELITALGHDVDVTEHGEAAIEKYLTSCESDSPFDIVILDLTIRGGLGGKETMERLLTIDPGIRAIVSSGYSDDAVVSDYNKYGFKARLTKPYNLEELRDTLNAMLG